MKNTALLVFSLLFFCLMQTAVLAAEKVVVVPLFSQTPVATGEIFNFYKNINQTQGRQTAYTVPTGKTLIITDITVSTMTGYETETGRFHLEGPEYDTKTAITIIYPDCIHHSFTNGIVFESGEDVIYWISIFPYSDFPARQYDITLTGIIVSNTVK